MHSSIWIDGVLFRKGYNPKSYTTFLFCCMFTKAKGQDNYLKSLSN